MSGSIITIMCAALLLSELPSGTNNPSTGAPARMTVTANVDKGQRAPQIEKEYVFVKQGKERLSVTEWVPAQGDRAGLELFFLIDDASNRPLDAAGGSAHLHQGSTIHHRNWNRLRKEWDSRDPAGVHHGSRISRQRPAATVEFGWGLWERLSSRGRSDEPLDCKFQPSRGGFGDRRGGPSRPWPRALTNPDVDTAASVAQRTGTIIHTIYFPGVGHWYRTFGRRTAGKTASPSSPR